tara:strand:+ start:316 stop:915 length:600 start_codon:yes stop_codon:yes gene_type:complete
MPTSNKIALLVHGYNVRDHGEKTIGRFRPFLISRGWDTIMFRMGWMGLIQVYLQNKKHARRLAAAASNAKKQTKAKVIAVGHSNGCAIIHMAATQFNAPIDRICYINPALEKDMVPGKQVKQIDVWYSPSDRPVQLAKYLPRHIWGEMGSTGYVGEDLRFTNFNKEDMAVSSNEHSDFAAAEKLSFFGPLIANRLIQGL